MYLYIYKNTHRSIHVKRESYGERENMEIRKGQVLSMQKVI